jgi:multisubunit Na+/H+ antiporter MnhB subunit
VVVVVVLVVVVAVVVAAGAVLTFLKNILRPDSVHSKFLSYNGNILTQRHIVNIDLHEQKKDISYIIHGKVCDLFYISRS